MSIAGGHRLGEQQGSYRAHVVFFTWWKLNEKCWSSEMQIKILYSIKIFLIKDVCQSVSISGTTHRLTQLLYSALSGLFGFSFLKLSLSCGYRHTSPVLPLQRQNGVTMVWSYVPPLYLCPFHDSANTGHRKGLCYSFGFSSMHRGIDRYWAVLS